MRLGILSPVLTILPRAQDDWELTAGPAELRIVAEAADRLGYHHLTCSEHVAIPESEAAVRRSHYWDPLVALGFVAGVTERLGLATYVVVLGYHHPLSIVKRYGTLDVVSKGRLFLGVGVGSLKEEFDLLGARFDDRGPRADDAIAAIRASFGRRTPEYAGSHYRYSGMLVEPCGPRQDIPIWVGGHTPRSLRRAVELGDGWMPFGIKPSDLSRMIARARESEAWARRSSPLEIVLAPKHALDPITEPHASIDTVNELVSAGATIVNVRFRATSVAHYAEQLEAMAEIALDPAI